MKKNKQEKTIIRTMLFVIILMFFYAIISPFFSNSYLEVNNISYELGYTLGKFIGRNYYTLLLLFILILFNLFIKKRIKSNQLIFRIQLLLCISIVSLMIYALFFTS